MASSCENADSQQEPLLRTAGPIPWKLHPIDFVDRFLSENMIPSKQRIGNIQQMRSPQNQRTYRENDRYGEEYQRQSILNRDSCSPENRQHAEYERRKLPQRRIPAPVEPQHWEYQRPHQNRGNYHQSPFKYPARKYDKFQSEHHPYYWPNDAHPSWRQNEWKSRGNTQHPRHLDTEPRSPRQDRYEPREKRKCKPRSTIQSQSPSTAVTDQAPSTRAPPAEKNAAENAVEPIISEDDEDRSQRTSLDQNAASQTVMPPPEQASSSSTRVSSQPPVDNAARNLPEKSSTSSQNGSKNQSQVIQIASNHQTAPSSSSRPASSTSSQPHVDNAAKHRPEKSSNTSQTGSKNQSSVQIASNHKTTSSSSSGPASSTSLQPAVQSVTESPANKTEHRSKNFNIESTNVKKDKEAEMAMIVKKFPHLYDQTEPYYRDKTRTEEAWVAISKELNESVRDCRSKWNSQRTKYRRIRKETDGQDFGKHAEFMAVMDFLPHKNRISETNSLGVDATEDQAQTEQAVSQSVPDIDEQFAKAMVGELRQFSPKVRTSIKADIYQVFAKWAKFTQDKSD